MNGAHRIVLVVGATGSIGRHVVGSALDHGWTVRALVRDAHRDQPLPPQVEVVVGDLTRVETLSSSVAGIDAVVFTQGTYGDPRAAEAVDYGGVRNVLTALGPRRARIALMTAIGATDRKGAHDWKRRAERLVRASGLSYTIVRPAWFDYNAADQHRLVMLQGDKPLVGDPSDGAIARRQIAEVLVRSLSSDAALGKTFELHSEQGPQQENFDPLFAALQADAANALDGVLDQPNMPVAEEPARIRADLDAVIAPRNAG
nr:SDR family oxidoreductase [Enterobacter roggenkampii]